MLIASIKSTRRTIAGHYRRFILNLRNSDFKTGQNFYCGYNTFISTKNKIIVGDDFYMGNYCHLSADAKIGNDVLFASFVSLLGGDHKIDDIKTTINKAGRDVFKKIIVEDNVWIGHGAIIMHGVTIKTGAIIAAGSVVTKDVGENAIFAGNPAKLIRYRKL